MFKRTKTLTMDVISFKDGGTVYVKILDGISDSDNLSKDGKPYRQCRVLDLDTGEEKLLSVLATIESTFEDIEDYVGRCYEIGVSAENKPGKNYKDVKIWEIEEPLRMREDDEIPF